MIERSEYMKSLLDFQSEKTASEEIKEAMAIPPKEIRERIVDSPEEVYKEVPLPDKKYDIIYCDPAWSYTDKAKAGNRGAGCKYKVMTLDELKKLPVNNIAKQDSIMFMWVTYPKLIDGTCMDTMKAWGFIPKTCAFTWVKYYKNLKPFMGMGRWTRANSELVILGTKGKPTRLSAGVRQLVETMGEDYQPEIVQSIPEKHSKKPEIVRDRIIELCGDLPRIELFARQSAEGWDSWGNEL